MTTLNRHKLEELKMMNEMQQEAGNNSQQLQRLFQSVTFKPQANYIDQ